MEALGRHCIIEYYDCPRGILDDPRRVREAMCAAAEAMGATIVAAEFHHFNPHGVSGMVVISESHLSIHTWPEYGYAAVDVFTCGDVVDPWLAHRILKTAFGAERESVIELRRGIFDAPAGTLPRSYDVLPGAIPIGEARVSGLCPEPQQETEFPAPSISGNPLGFRKIGVKGA